MNSSIEIIHHRCLFNDGSHGIEYLDYLLENGIYSYEFDLFDFGASGICVGHPSYIEKYGFDCKLLHTLLDWGTDRNIKIYFDIKFPHTWKTSMPSLFKIFQKIRRSKICLISYDMGYFMEEAIEANFSFGIIMDNAPDAPPMHPVVLPISEVLKKPASIRTYPAIIASEVNSMSDIEIASHYKIKRVMSDNPLNLIRFIKKVDDE